MAEQKVYATVSHQSSRTVYVRSAPPPAGMTVWHLRDFVRALDAEGVPDHASIEAHRSHQTMHLIGLSVRVTTTAEPDPEPR